jgi:hypothetical protein
MNLDYQSAIPSNFHPASKVWIYQSNRLFSISEAFQLEEAFTNFTSHWKSHGASVKAYANLFFGQFIVLMADETATTVGGCSTDSSVHFIQEIEKKFRVSLLDRQTLGFIIKDKIQLLHLSQLNYAIENNFISKNTLYFNNLVLTKKEFEQNWIIPIEKSWLANKLTSIKV